VYVTGEPEGTTLPPLELGITFIAAPGTTPRAARRQALAELLAREFGLEWGSSGCPEPV
jgi:hypothetical protein